jgi:moderate conductance mechanosensitive channel
MISLLHIVLIWTLAWILLLFTRNLLKVFRAHVVERITRATDYRRIDTLSNVFRHAATTVIAGVAIMLSLGEVGISITPVLATAGVAGIAIGFGAQSLVRDFFSGLFLLIEDQVSEGDVIEAAGKSGHVEEVTLRHIRIRDDDGSVHFIPNGIITTVTNRSREYGYAVVDISVPRREDMERMFDLLRQTGGELRADPALGADMLGDVEIAGIEKVDDASITVRCRIKALPMKQATLRREFLRRVTAALDTYRGGQEKPAPAQ